MPNVQDAAFSHHLSFDAVADYFVHHDTQRAEPDVTPLKLQKLLYLAQANYLASTENRLFDEPVEAFEHGPVVYKAYTRFPGRQIIATRENDNLAGCADKELPEDVRIFLDEVWLKYKDHSASQLRNLTHKQDPWKENYVENMRRIVIPDSDMAHYFRQRVPAAERVFHSAVTLVPQGFLEALDEEDTVQKLRSFWT